MTTIFQEIREAAVGDWKFHPNAQQRQEPMSDYLRRKVTKVINTAGLLALGETTFFVAADALLKCTGASFLFVHPAISIISLVIFGGSCLSTFITLTGGSFKVMRDIGSIAKNYNRASPYHIQGRPNSDWPLTFKKFRLIAIIQTAANLILLAVAGEVVTAVTIGIIAAAGTYLLYKLAVTPSPVRPTPLQLQVN